MQKQRTAFEAVLFVYSCVLDCGRMRLSSTPTTAESPIPPMVNVPIENSAPPIPRIRMIDTMTKLRVLPRSTLFFTRLFTPTAAIVPKSRSMMPPNTAWGMVLSNALILPNTEKRMPNTAAIRRMLGSAILVSEIAPVTSE